MATVAGKVPSHWPITLTHGAVALLSIFLPLALVRFLSLEEMGRYNIFFLYVSVLPGFVLTSGLNSGLYYWAGRYPEAKPQIRQSWTLSLLMGTVIGALGFVLAPWAAGRMKNSAFDIQLVMVSFPFALAAAFLEELLIARGSIWKGAWFGSGFNILRTSGLLAAAWWTRRVDVVFWVYLSSVALKAGVGYWLARPSGDVDPILSKAHLRSVLHYALPVSLAGLSALALHYVDQLVLSFYLSHANFALYAMGCLSVPPLEIFEMSVNRVLIPRLSEAFHAKELARAAAMFSDGIAELFRFLMPSAVGLFLFAEPIIQILFTERYLPAAQYLRIYSINYLIMAFPSSLVPRARGDGSWILRISLAFTVLSTVTTWLAAQRWQAIGALSAILINQVLIRVYSLGYHRRSFEASYRHFLPFKEMTQQTVLAVAGGVVALTIKPLFDDSVHWFLAAGSIFSVVYLAGTYGLALRRLAHGEGPIPVLELAQTLELGGLERTVLSLAQTLNQNPAFRFHVATYDHAEGKPSLAGHLKKSGVPLLEWRKGSGVSAQTVWRLVRLIFAHRIRILHVHDLGPLVYGSLTKAALLGHAVMVVTLHTALDLKAGGKRRALYRIFLRFADHIVAVSAEVRDALLDAGISPDRIQIIANGASFLSTPAGSLSGVERFARRRALIGGLRDEVYQARWILCLARLHPGKGHEQLLQVWKALPEETRAQLGLIFVGQETSPGFASYLRTLIQECPQAHRIVLAGPSESPQEWVQCADLFMSGSLLEGMPLAPLEAAGSGLPTLLTQIEGHRFLDSWAHFFDPNHPQTGAQHITKLLRLLDENDPNHTPQKRWESAAPLRERWGASSMAEAYAKLFKTGTLMFKERP